MKYLFVAAALAAICNSPLAGAAPAANAGTANAHSANVDSATHAIGTAADPAAHAPAAVAPGGASGGGDAWRYKQHRGFWWYWLPSEKWVIWSGGKWIPYDPVSFAQLEAARSPRATYYRGGTAGSRSGTAGYPELGQWGRVRYNSYGQREYPYSRRNSGIRQLGPVPAMGGVRSLPGWGGER
jgi:hypothetical protein